MYMLLMVVAVFGTTISPYLFFWQAAQEMEDSQHRQRTEPHTGKPTFAATCGASRPTRSSA